MLLSLFCGAGGLDTGFEKAGYNIGLAYDLRRDSVESYNANRRGPPHARVADVAELTTRTLDGAFGSTFLPMGVIGGPPCQSFSQANVNQREDDPRHVLPLAFARLVDKLNVRRPVDFFVLENVVGLTLTKHRLTLQTVLLAFEKAGYHVSQATLDAQNFSTPQTRKRLFIVGFSRARFGELAWSPPEPSTGVVGTVRKAIGGLPPPVHFRRGLEGVEFPHHANHWCMQPKSPKFTKPGALNEGNIGSRSFKTLAWDKPSIAVAYGHREVHVHPEGKRRLSVYEAMKLQGFPHEYVLKGTLSSQITQISEAVPPPLAEAVAISIRDQLCAAGPSNRAARSIGRMG